jgi:hypothetical protein
VPVGQTGLQVDRLRPLADKDSRIFCHAISFAVFSGNVGITTGPFSQQFHNVGILPAQLLQLRNLAHGDRLPGGADGTLDVLHAVDNRFKPVLQNSLLQ